MAEARILLEEPDKSHHAAHRISENGIFHNLLIHGDNLLALKALEQEFVGKMKCVFIDPPEKMVDLGHIGTVLAGGLTCHVEWSS